MNEEAREALVAAEMRGQRQIKDRFNSGDGLCALGVLGWREGQAFLDDFLKPHWGFSSNRLQCPFCERVVLEETRLVAHFNDDHDFSFLDIARKMP